jgi:ankyrin repeat protein
MNIFDAAINGDIGRVRELLDRGVDPNIIDDHGITALIFASQKGHTEIVRLLLENNADINITDYFSWTALIYASSGGYTEIVGLLLENGADPNIRKNGQPSLPWASRRGHTDIVRMLLDHGADPNITDNFSRTALLEACSRSSDSTDIVRLLLDNGADPNITNKDGLTPLMVASRNGHTEIVGMLLDNGADPNIREDNGDTALMAAESEGHGDTARVIRNHIDLQRTRQNLALATSFMSRDTPLQYIDYNLDNNPIIRLMSHARKYNPSVNMRMKDERRRDPLTKSKQRLASMRAMHSREGPIGSVRYDPSIMEGIGKHLSSMRPDAGVQRRMIEDKKGGKRNRKYYTRKRF